MIFYAETIEIIGDEEALHIPNERTIFYDIMQALELDELSNGFSPKVPNTGKSADASVTIFIPKENATANSLANNSRNEKSYS